MCIFILKNGKQCGRKCGTDLCWQHKNKNELDKCPICLDIKIYPLAISTVCIHTYCKVCFELWFKQNKSCPVCRAVMESFQIKKTVNSIPEIYKTKFQIRIENRNKRLSKLDYMSTLKRNEELMNIKKPVVDKNFLLNQINYYLSVYKQVNDQRNIEILEKYKKYIEEKY